MKTSNHFSRKAAYAVAGLTAFLSLAACSTAPHGAEAKADLRHDSAEALQQARQNDPTLDTFLRNSAGHAVFPSVGKGAVGVGGAYGKGDVYQSGGIVGYCDMTQASIGLQLGGQSYTEILVFENPAAVEPLSRMAILPWMPRPPPWP